MRVEAEGTYQLTHRISPHRLKQQAPPAQEAAKCNPFFSQKPDLFFLVNLA